MLFANIDVGTAPGTPGAEVSIQRNWVDGNPIFQRSVSLTLTLSSTSYYTAPTGLTGVVKVIYFWGTLQVAASTTATTSMYVLNTGRPDIPNNAFGSWLSRNTTTGALDLWVNTNNAIMTPTITMVRNYLTVLYTKA